jgi:hypothetical protein
MVKLTSNIAQLQFASYYKRYSDLLFYSEIILLHITDLILTSY